MSLDRKTTHMKSKRTFHRVITFAVAFVFVVSTCPPFFQQTQPAALAASRQPVRARRGIVAATNQLAARVGVEVLQRGGNAVDAAVAVAFALAVTHPAAGNLGGGGFMMVRLRNGKTTAIDYREMAPGKSTQTMYLGAVGTIDMSLTRSGYLAPGVPGTSRPRTVCFRWICGGGRCWVVCRKCSARTSSSAMR